MVNNSRTLVVAGVAVLVWMQLMFGPKTTTLLVAQSSTTTTSSSSSFDQDIQNRLERLEQIIHQLTYPAMVDLLPWEQASRHGKCEAPESMKKTTEADSQACCPGSVSGGGMVRYYGESCQGDMYHRMAIDTRNYLAGEYDDQDSSSHHGNDCDACAIVQILAAHNWTLSFSGDSMMRQTFVGLQCELLRRGGFQVEKQPQIIVPRAKDAFWKVGMSTIDVVHVHVPHGSNNTDAVARIRFYFHYRPADNNTEVEQMARDSDMVIFDHGLHYPQNQNKEYIHRMASMLTAFENLKLVAWRETSAQHFNTSTGEFTWAKKTLLQEGCHPIAQRPSPTVLDKMIQAAAQAQWKVQFANDPEFLTSGVVNDDSSNASTLVIVPFFNFTYGLHYAHRPDDCTHICSSPDLWLPIWRGLRLAMERIN